MADCTTRSEIKIKELLGLGGVIGGDAKVFADLAKDVKAKRPMGSLGPVGSLA